MGDKANDAIRVDGRDLRVKVVGEGGNLGMTQRGRIEAALQGVILNTDAIDNSAGVDCSDHEVNIKIFVDRMVAAGKLDPPKNGPISWPSMTDEVGRLVLQDNIDQNILLLNDRMQGCRMEPQLRAADGLAGEVRRPQARSGSPANHGDPPGSAWNRARG